MRGTQLFGRSCGRRAATALVLVGLTAGAAVTGCGRPRQVVLIQDFAPPSQRELALTGEVAACAPVDGERACALTFPLPGAHRGPRAFMLYLRLPGGNGTFDAGAGGVRGFLVQEVGDLAGRTDIVGGTVRVKSVWLRPQQQTLELDLACSDGARLRGTVRVTTDSGQVRAIEQEFAADVRRLGEEVTE